MAAAVAPVKGTNAARPSGISGAPQALQANGGGPGGFTSPFARLQQAAMNPATRNGPPSPPLGGNAQKGSMPPPSHALAPSPLSKEQGKSNSGVQVCLLPR